MKRILTLMSLSFCLLMLPSVSGSAQADQSKLLRSCQRYQRALTTRADLPLEQRALLALTLAAAETRTTDPVELQEAYRQVLAPETMVPTSDTSYVWGASAWQNDRKTTYTYHGTKEASATEADWNGVQWRDTSRTLFTYDGSAWPDTMTSQEMRDSVWVNVSRSILVYYTSDSIQMLFQNWRDSVGGVWLNWVKSTLTYSSGRLETATTVIWDVDAWVDMMKTTYTYDGGGHLTHMLNQAWVDGSGWTDLIQTIYTLDSFGRDTLNVSQVYIPASSLWINMSMNQSSYDGSSNKILGVYRTWKDSTWSQVSADTLKYDGEHLVEAVHYVVGGSLTRTLYTYDAGGNETLVLHQQYIVPTWENVSKTIYVYGEVFLCGDVDHSDDVNISDAVRLLCYIFEDCPAPDPKAVGDVDCSGDINIADVVYLLNYIFDDGPAPCAAC